MNYTQEVINSKISENDISGNCSLVHLVTLISPFRVSLVSFWVRNMFLDLNIIENSSFLKIKYFV